MESQPARRHRFKLRSARVSIIALVLLIIASIPVGALTVPTVTQTNMTDGWGDPGNDYSWSMAWFQGKLYVGTSRYEMCVEYMTYAHYGITQYSTNPAPGVTCPADPTDLDLRAEIWEYTPRTDSWRMVYQSPTAPNPVNGKPLALDIGYRGMIVYNGALFVFGVTADEVYTSLLPNRPPRILRTIDGTHYTALNIPAVTINYPNSQNNFQPGVFYPMGFRSPAILNNMLYATATPSLTGDGALMQISSPFGTSPQLTQLSPDTMQIFEINAFNNQMYIGGANPDTGYFVDRSDLVGATPTFVPVVTNGAGMGKVVNSVVSMHVYKSQLYVGASGWYSGGRNSELIRISANDSWQLVVGKPRLTLQGLKFPISGLPAGFGNPFNAHFWRIEDTGTNLYVGTNDDSWFFTQFPLLGFFASWQYGFDIYSSPGGVSWFPLTINAFGTGPDNFGVRTMQNDGNGNLYIGSANHADGTLVWEYGVPSSSSGGGGKFGSVQSSGVASAASKSTSSAGLAPMTTVEADAVQQGVAVTWNKVSGATRYHVYRSDYVSNQSVGLIPSLTPLLPFSGDLAAPPVQVDPNTPADVWLPGPFHEIGATSGTTFVDTSAAADGQYAYYVVYEMNRQLSDPSNVAYAPSQLAPVSFSSVLSTAQDLAQSGQIPQSDAAAVATGVNKAKNSSAKGDPNGASSALTQVQQNLQASDPNDDNPQVDDLAAQVQHLERLVRLGELDNGQ